MFLMSQDSCSSPNHHVYILARKEESDEGLVLLLRIFSKIHTQHFCLYFIGQNLLPNLDTWEGWKCTLYSDPLYAQKERDERCHKRGLSSFTPVHFFIHLTIHLHLFPYAKCTNPLLKEGNLKLSQKKSRKSEVLCIMRES